MGGPIIGDGAFCHRVHVVERTDKLSLLITSEFQIASLPRLVDCQTSNLGVSLWKHMKGNLWRESQVGSAVFLSAVAGADCVFKNLNLVSFSSSELYV